MSVLDRAALEESPLADLHAIASELSIDGYRRLRRPELIDAILARQSGTPEPEPVDVEEPADEDERPAARRRRGRRGGRGRVPARDEEPAEETEGSLAEELPGEAEPSDDAALDEVLEDVRPPEAREAEETVEGVVELLPGGSGFVRVTPPEPSDEDVYISSAQVKRLELLSGDRIAGPRRPPRRSERFASLIRVDTINGLPASELASGARFDELPAAFAEERIALDAEDPTLKAIEWLTPFGKGSRVTIVGGPRAGKTEAVRRLAAALSGREDLQILLALAGIRPEEISEWERGALRPSAAVSMAASQDAQDQAVELVVDQARRIAARGGDALVLIDTLTTLHTHSARRALAAARNIVDGGSLTVVATGVAPFGGETTVIALDAQRAAAGRLPALDLVASGTMRPELLVGEAGAEAIADAHRDALERQASDQ
jgi:transcription termination factor Rho